MIASSRLASRRPLRHAGALFFLSSNVGRSAAYRRITTLQTPCRLDHASPLPKSPFVTTFNSPCTLLLQRANQQRLLISKLHTTPSRFQSQRPSEDIRDPPRDAEHKESKSEDAEQSKAHESDAKDEKPENEQEKTDQSESKKEGQKKGQKDTPPPPPHGDKSPWQVFTDTLRSEFKASKEWNESTKQLASSAHQFTESDGVRKARATADAATSRTGDALKVTGKVLGSGAAWTWDTKVVQGIRGGVNATGRGIEKATRPVRKSKSFQSIKEAVDDGSSSRYGGWVEKEERRKLKEARDLKEVQDGTKPAAAMQEDPNAGTNVTVHKDSAWKESWGNFRDSSKVMQSIFSLKSTYAESENPLISTARSISDGVAGFFAENETALVIKKFREMDPSFQLEPFLRDMREWILPEVLDAYVRGDVETLKQWLSAAQFQVYAALMQQYTTAGLVSDGRILDIRHVDVLNARILEPGDVPVFIITCRTQEVHVYRNKKTRELAAGMEDRVQLVTYAIGVTRVPEDVGNPETRGWRLIELQKAGRDYI